MYKFFICKLSNYVCSLQCRVLTFHLWWSDGKWYLLNAAKNHWYWVNDDIRSVLSMNMTCCLRPDVQLKCQQDFLLLQQNLEVLVSLQQTPLSNSFSYPGDIIMTSSEVISCSEGIICVGETDLVSAGGFRLRRPVPLPTTRRQHSNMKHCVCTTARWWSYSFTRGEARMSVQGTHWGRKKVVSVKPLAWLWCVWHHQIWISLWKIAWFTHDLSNTL